MTIAGSIVKQLKEAGVKYVFGIPGGPWVPFMEAMRENGIQFILVSNEGSAGFMADVSCRLTGVPGVCHGTFGPGATNLSTGVGGGLLDRSALIAMTSEIPDEMLHRVTQMNVDHQALFAPLTKGGFRLTPDNPAQQVFNALQDSLSGIPGPIHIGVPSNMGDQKVEAETIRSTVQPRTFDAPSEASIQKVAEALGKAERPLIAVGLTAARLGLKDQVQKIADRMKAPVVITPMAKGILSEDHPGYQGVLFHALSTELIDVISKADKVFSIGYDPIEFNFEAWMPETLSLIALDEVNADIDQSRYTVEAETVGNLESGLDALIPLLETSGWTEAELRETPERIKKIFAEKARSFGPVAAIQTLRDVMNDEGILTLDVGAHLHLAGQLWRTPDLNRVLMTNGWSSMGFGVPAAIAAKLNCPDKQVACLTGDGGFLMMAGEIVTARRLKLNTVFVVLSDRELSLIAVKQDWKSVMRYGTDLYQEGYFQAETFFGAPVLKVQDTDAMRTALEEAFTMDGPVIVEVVVDGAEYKDLISKTYK